MGIIAKAIKKPWLILPYFVMKFLYVAPYREATTDYFEADFNHLDGIHNAFHTGAANPPGKPQIFEKMKELAGILSKGYPEMRVNFYDDHGKIYFGEITFFKKEDLLHGFLMSGIINLENISI